MTRSEVTFAQIPYEHWSYPDFVNQTKAEQEMRQMGQEGVICELMRLGFACDVADLTFTADGDNLSYRHMCRFNSGFFYRQKVGLVRLISTFGADFRLAFEGSRALRLLLASRARRQVLL